MGQASETQAAGTTRSSSSRPVPALTGDLDPIIVEEAEPAPIVENETIPTEAQAPVTEGEPTPTTEQDNTHGADPTPAPVDTPMSTDRGPTMRLGSITPTSDSELTQLSDTDA